jgi:hypothetical protein
MSRGLYVYAVARSDAELPETGIRHRPTRAVRDLDLKAVVSEIDLGRSRLDEEDMWEHEEIVEALMASGPVLPMRFGTILADETAVALLLLERREELHAALERVRGAVELGVRATVAAEDPTPAADAASGTAYMRSRLAASRRRDELRRRIHEPLAELARDSALRMPSPGEAQMRAAYLVDCGAVSAFCERVNELERERVASGLVCTGPWPPYSFSGGDG